MTRTGSEAERSRRQLWRLTAAMVASVALVAVGVAIGSSQGTSRVVRLGTPAAKADAVRVERLLTGIPEPGNNTLGSASAAVTVTEYGDLECPACAAFALAPNVRASDGGPGSGVENKLIAQYVRTGKARLVYRSLETATAQGAEPSQFGPQQSAALAAGLQHRGWYYIQLFYNEQGQEGTSYVTEGYLDGLARQIPGLDYRRWLSARHDRSLSAQVFSDGKAANTLGLNQTPSIVVRGPKGQARPIQGVPTWSQLTSAISSVS